LTKPFGESYAKFDPRVALLGPTEIK